MVALEQSLISEPKVIQLALFVALKLQAIPTSLVQDSHIPHTRLQPNRHHHHERPRKLL